MANLIRCAAVSASEPLRMSNATTAVFLDVLALAASDLARTDWERRFVHWLVRRDQTRSGLGVVGFDVAELGWTGGGFEDERRFVLAVIEAARAGQGWERLPFTVGDDARLFGALGRFRELVAGLPAESIGEQDDDVWTDELEDLGTCGVHQVPLHELGCIICNDAPLDVGRAKTPHRTAGMP